MGPISNTGNLTWRKQACVDSIEKHSEMKGGGGFPIHREIERERGREFVTDRERGIESDSLLEGERK